MLLHRSWLRELEAHPQHDRHHQYTAPKLMKLICQPSARLSGKAFNTIPVVKPATAPPRLPTVFMQPETMPEYLRPMSRQLAHAEPIVRSLQNAAMATASTNSHGVGGGHAQPSNTPHKVP